MPYQISMSKAVLANGWDFIPIISPDPVVSSFPLSWVNPIFVEHGILDQPGTVIMENIHKLNLIIFLQSIIKLRKDLLFTFNKILNSNSIIFFESFNPFQLFSLLLAIHSCKYKKNITLWLLFRGGPNWGGGNYKLIAYGFSYSFKLLLFIFRLFNRNIKITYFTDSEILVTELTIFYKNNVKILPIPHTELPEESLTPSKTTDGLIKVWWPGTPRVDKGSEVIKNFIENIAPDQCNIMLIASKNNLIDFRLSKIKVEVLENNIPNSKYQNLFYEADIIILPYDKGIYNESTSGIFTEAIFASKLTMVTDGTWMSSEYKRYGIYELSFIWDELDIHGKINELMRNKKLLKKIKMMSKSYRDFHSVPSFAQHINQYYLSK